MTFDELKLELRELLQQPNCNQKLIDDHFRKLNARNKLPVFDGLTIVGFKWSNMKWLTAFHPADAFSVMQTDPKAIALGYSDGYQLYLLPHVDDSGTLIVRYGMGPNYQMWVPDTMGMPQVGSLLFLALERANALGHINAMRGAQ